MWYRAMQPGQLNVIGYRRPDRIELARAAGDQADAKARRHGVVPHRESG